MRELWVLADGERLGTLVQRGDRRTLRYAPSWAQRPDAWPLSVTLPLTAWEHRGARLEAWLWGLLPDSERVLADWGRRYGVSAGNAFALLSVVGEDCAGAVQFVSPARADALAVRPEGDTVEPLTEAQVGQRLRALREDGGASRGLARRGQFSLAGAQPKDALWHDGQRWGVPTGATPTTHILKPPVPGFTAFCENEHLTLRLARAAGLPAVASQVRRFGDETAIVVSRYDRERQGGRLARVHQEDWCQALGVHPRDKYQADGGPGAGAVAALLWNDGAGQGDDVAWWVDALAFQWLVGNSDAHAKNYAWRLSGAHARRPAPLYDVASALPYLDPRDVRLAMKVGAEYEARRVTGDDWARLAREVRLPAATVQARVSALAARVAGAVAGVAAEAERDQLDPDFVSRWADALSGWLAHCQSRL